MKLEFIVGRTNSERFVIKINKPLSKVPVDFARMVEHNIVSLSLVSDDVTLSTGSGEIKTSDIKVINNGREHDATEIQVMPSQETLTKMKSQQSMELIANGDERLCFIDVFVDGLVA